MNNKMNFIILIGICLFMLINPNNCLSNNDIHNDDLVRSSFSVIEPCQFENDIDSITVLYWNAWGCNYDQYTISYSLTTGNMVVYVEYLKSIPAYPIICSEQSRLFLSSWFLILCLKSLKAWCLQLWMNTTGM